MPLEQLLYIRQISPADLCPHLLPVTVAVSASLGLTDCYQVDMLGLHYTSDTNKLTQTNTEPNEQKSLGKSPTTLQRERVNCQIYSNSLKLKQPHLHKSKHNQTNCPLGKVMASLERMRRAAQIDSNKRKQTYTNSHKTIQMLTQNQTNAQTHTNSNKFKR